MPQNSGYYIEIAGQSVDHADNMQDEQASRDFIARGQALGTIAIAAPSPSWSSRWRH
jgi:hypothetical protein